jgi:hypothetical protein
LEQSKPRGRSLCNSQRTELAVFNRSLAQKLAEDGLQDNEGDREPLQGAYEQTERVLLILRQVLQRQLIRPHDVTADSTETL